MLHFFSLNNGTICVGQFLCCFLTRRLVPSLTSEYPLILLNLPFLIN